MQIELQFSIGHCPNITSFSLPARKISQPTQILQYEHVPSKKEVVDKVQEEPTPQSLASHQTHPSWSSVQHFSYQRAGSSAG